MTVNQLLRQLNIEKKRGNGKLLIRLFAHDQNPKDSSNCDGDLFTCNEFTNDVGETFIGMQA